MALKQDPRLLNLKTPLGENELLLTSFQGVEGVSQLFRFELEMLSDNNDVAPQQIVGKNVTFSVRLADDSLRHFNGLVSRFSAGDEDEGGRRAYRAEVVPWFWFLSRQADCRIFENKSIKDILEKIFQDRGFSDYKIRLSGTHPKRQHCVQYRETDFDFCCRLMEEEGVWYTFVHEDGEHTLLIADSKNEYVDCSQQEVDYPTDVGSLAMEDHLRTWEHRYEFRSGKVSHADYNVLNDQGDNFLRPSVAMDVHSETVVDLPDAKKYELFDYPGIYTVKQEGTDFADVRMEAEEVEHDVVEGSGIVRAFTPGGKFKIRQHRAKSEQGKSYVIVTLAHTAHETEGYETGAPLGEGYRNSFTCIPDSVNYRPPRTTPKPSVQGVQSAIVVGDDEIPVDKHGRVKVRMQWLRQGKSDPDQTCWVRVSQMWAGAEWGGMHIPHIAQEVLIAFVDGDPDRPICVGRVYNEEQKVPLTLPDNKTKSIIRDYGDNQLIMEGKPDEQFIHLQQACGNELVMNGIAGKESVQLRDKFGNELVMDSVTGTTRLSSPAHNSTLILGSSIYQACDSSNSSYTVGDTINAHKGMKHDRYIGLRSQVDIGGYYEAQLGFKTTFVGGTEVNGRIGSVLGLALSKQVDLNAKDYVQHSKGAMKVDSDEALGFVGGPGDASKGILNGEKIHFQYKPSDEKGRGDWGKGEVASLLAAAASSAYMAVNGWQMESMKEAIEAKIAQARESGRNTEGKTQAEIDAEVTNIAKEWSNAEFGTAEAIVMGAIGGATGLLNTWLSKNPSIVEDHSAPNSEIILDQRGVRLGANNHEQYISALKDKGVFLVSNDNKITIRAQMDVSVTSKGGIISLTASEAKYGKTKINQKNLMVMA